MDAQFSCCGATHQTWALLFPIQQVQISVKVVSAFPLLARSKPLAPEEAKAEAQRQRQRLQQWQLQLQLHWKYHYKWQLQVGGSSDARFAPTFALLVQAGVSLSTMLNVSTARLKQWRAFRALLAFNLHANVAASSHYFTRFAAHLCALQILPITLAPPKRAAHLSNYTNVNLFQRSN